MQMKLAQLAMVFFVGAALAAKALYIKIFTVKVAPTVFILKY
jgi:hypothetical protein